jgi:hypothetical protein
VSPSISPLSICTRPSPWRLTLVPTRTHGCMHGPPLRLRVHRNILVSVRAAWPLCVVPLASMSRSLHSSNVCSTRPPPSRPIFKCH